MQIWERTSWRLSERGRWWFDVILATGLLLPVLVLVVDDSRWPNPVFSVLELAPLYLRRRWPATVFAVVALASLAQTAFTDNPVWGQAGLPVALYSVARYRGGRWGPVALGVGLVGAVVATYVWFSSYGRISAGAFVTYAVGIGLIATVAWALGALARLRGAYVDTLVERNRTLLVEAEQRAALAAQDERARIAREMHDVVAHGLSVIVVQADGARFAAEQDPQVAAKALGTISEAAREALTEMRRLLGLLRADDTGTTPQPRLSDLPDLVEDAREAGTEVRATLPPPDVGVPEGVGLTAYRIVQEALSNIRKHAGPDATASVLVTVGDEVTVEVRDDGRGAAADPSQGSDGLGLVGMAERVAAHDGTLETGPMSGGGFRVWARIPL